MRMKKLGMTLVELMVGVVIAGIILTVAFKLYSNVVFQFQHGMVNLQNFQEAHLTMAYLRRDFSTACPFLSEADKAEELRNTVRRPVDVLGEKNLGQNQKIFISDNNIAFHRFRFEPFSNNPKPLVERVEYRFDPVLKTLTRVELPSKETKVFKGLKNVLFKCYVHDVNPNIPILWVKLVLDFGEGEGGAQKGKPLEITTSISAAFITDISNYKNWNYRAYHRTED